MTPDEAQRHEWFAGAAVAPATGPAQSAKAHDDSSEGVFSASSSVGSGAAADRSTMYHVYKAGKSSNKCDAAGRRRDSNEALLNCATDGTSQDPAGSPDAAAVVRNSKRFDGNSNNLDDSGTFLPSIL